MRIEDCRNEKGCDGCMSWRYISTQGMRSGDLIDGSFLGRGLLGLDLSKKKRPYVGWIKKFIAEVNLWIGARS